MELLHQNIRIRNALASDAPQLATWWNDGSIMAHAGFPNGLGTSPDKIIRELATDSDKTRRRLILDLDGCPIGEMCFRIQGTAAEIGIKICLPECREKGTGRKALSMLIRELFRLGYSPICLDTDLENTRAQHVYETLGFRKLRINHDSWKNQLGQLRSSVDYQLTADTFHDFAV